MVLGDGPQHDRIREILARWEDPRDAADHVVAAAVEAGGHDNATAVVVEARRVRAVLEESR